MDAARPVADEFKTKQRRHWDAVAGGWAAWAEWTEREFRPLTDWLREAACWQPGARVLDVGCGPGYPAIAAAGSVRPGSVVGIDLSREMVEVATRRAASAGSDNIEFLQMDADDLRFDTGSFDAVTNAYGLMFCPDPVKALRQIHRVLRPGGRVAIVTWDELAKSPFFSVITGVAAPFLGLAAPDPSAPGPFRFAPPSRLEALLGEAGFIDRRAESLPIALELGSVDEYLRVFTDVAWKSRMAVLSQSDAARLRKEVTEAVRPFVAGGRLSLVATSCCASGRTPS